MGASPPRSPYLLGHSCTDFAKQEDETPYKFHMSGHQSWKKTSGQENAHMAFKTIVARQNSPLRARLLGASHCTLGFFVSPDFILQRTNQDIQ